MKNSKSDFPEQTGFYKLDVKNGGRWRYFKTARLQISVGQEYHEAEKFMATMEWVKHRFDKVIICVNDTLQRHNACFAEGIDEKKAFVKADRAGQHWVMRNAEYIKSLPDYQIIRWEEWRNRADYKPQLDEIKKLYMANEHVRNLINETIEEFWARCVKREPDIDPKRFKDFAHHSRTYLLEETAIFFLMYKEQKAADIYPGSRMVPFEIAQKFSTHAPTPDLGPKAFTAVSFTVNKNHERAKKQA